MKNNNCSDCSEKTVEGRAVIDKETGIIINRIDLSKAFIFTTSKNESKRELELDVVTDEDVARPDLSKYGIEEE